ncbi:MAG: DUF4150 domain-containing protein [Proteobacteria bacterium]|nr:DUF4150 domain-containing protein [Pseudomonadota bacterium]
MALEHLVSRDGQFVVVCLTPDVCLTPGKTGYPIPYPITHKLDEARQCSANVFQQGEPVYLDNESYVDNVHGDEPGKGGGVISQVNVKISHNIAKSANVFINGRSAVRTGDAMWMNWKRP